MYAAIAILVVVFLLKDMNGFMSAQAQKSLTRLSGAIKRLGFFDYVDVVNYSRLTPSAFEAVVCGKPCKP